MADVKQELPSELYKPFGFCEFRRAKFDDILALLQLLEPEQQEAFARALPSDILLCALCALEGPDRANMLAEFRRDDRGGKYFTKARVYGAIACQYREALEKLRGVSEIARNALTRRDAGVPVEQLEAFEKLMRVEEERDAIKRLAEGAEEQRDIALKRAEEAETRAAECALSSAATVSELRAENERLRAELATVAERQREACAKAVEDWAWRFHDNRPATDIIRETPLVTDAPSKPATWVESLGLLGMRWATVMGHKDGPACAREIAAWPREGAWCGPCGSAWCMHLSAQWLSELEQTSPELSPSPADTAAPQGGKKLGQPKPEELCAKCGKRWDKHWFGGACGGLFEPTPPKSRCVDDPGCDDPPPEHGVNRPGQGKHLQHEAVVMANEAIRRENAAQERQALDGSEDIVGQLGLIVMRSEDKEELARALQRGINEIRILRAELATLRAKESPEAAYRKGYGKGWTHALAGNVAFNDQYQPPEK